MCTQVPQSRQLDVFQEMVEVKQEYDPDEEPWMPESMENVFISPKIEHGDMLLTEDIKLEDEGHENEESRLVEITATSCGYHTNRN